MDVGPDSAAARDALVAHIDFVEHENALIARRAIAETHLRAHTEQLLERATRDIAALELQLEAVTRNAQLRSTSASVTRMVGGGLTVDEQHRLVEQLQETRDRLAALETVEIPTTTRHLSASRRLRRVAEDFSDVEVHVFAGGRRIA